MYVLYVMQKEMNEPIHDYDKAKFAQDKHKYEHLHFANTYLLDFDVVRQLQSSSLFHFARLTTFLSQHTSSYIYNEIINDTYQAKYISFY